MTDSVRTDAIIAEIETQRAFMEARAATMAGEIAVLRAGLRDRDAALAAEKAKVEKQAKRVGELEEAAKHRPAEAPEAQPAAP